jgi:hypothetical protein
VTTKGVEIDVHPSFIVPSVVLLNVIAMVVAIYMVADTLVILTGDRESVDIDRDVLVQSMVDHSGCAEATVFSISSSQKISVNVESRGEWEFVVGH